jgi:hypothetical protein
VGSQPAPTAWPTAQQCTRERVSRGVCGCWETRTPPCISPSVRDPYRQTWALAPAITRAMHINQRARRDSPSATTRVMHCHPGKAGDALLLDSRVLHCGGANSSSPGRRRRLLYLTFRGELNPQATGMGGSCGVSWWCASKLCLDDGRRPPPCTAWGALPSPRSGLWPTLPARLYTHRLLCVGVSGSPCQLTTGALRSLPIASPTSHYHPMC